MKKGCFIGFVVLLFVLIAGSIYIYKFHKEDFLNFSKKTLLSMIKNELEDEFETIRNTPQKDTLRTLAFDYLEKLKTDNLEEKKTEIETLSRLIKETLEDKKITSEELSKIREIIKNYESNEKNGN